MSRRPALLLDTSAAISLVVADHEQHAATVAAVRDDVLGLAGHAAFECLSVLTRLPPPARLSPAAAGRVLAAFPATAFLSASGAAELLVRLPALGISGGSVYDALVGATAVEHDLELLSLDLRARSTYRELGVRLR